MHNAKDESWASSTESYQFTEKISKTLHTSIAATNESATNRNRNSNNNCTDEGTLITIRLRLSVDLVNERFLLLQFRDAGDCNKTSWRCKSHVKTRYTYQYDQPRPISHMNVLLKQNSTGELLTKWNHWSLNYSVSILHNSCKEIWYAYTCVMRIHYNVQHMH